MRASLLFAACLATACSPGLVPPPGTEIECDSDSECPGALQCQLRTRRCIDPDVNVDLPANVAALAATDGRLGTQVPLSVTLLDPDSESPTEVDVELEFSLDGTSYFPARAENGLSVVRLSASAVGENHTIVWDALADAIAGVGGLTTTEGYNASGTLVPAAVVAPTAVRIRASVPDGGTSAETDLVSLGSELPDLRSPTNSGAQSGLIPISVEVSDAELDPVDLEYEFSTDPSASTPTWRTALVSIGATQSLPTTSMPTPHLVLWDSTADSHPMDAMPQGVGPTAPGEVVVRVRARETLDDGTITYTDWFYTPTFSVINQRRPRILAFTSPRSLSQAGGGLVPIQFTLSDEERDPVDVAFAYSLDDGVTWLPANEYPSIRSGGSRALITRSLEDGGVEHYWAWDATGLTLEVPATLQLRLRATDSLNAEFAEDTLLFGGVAAVQTPVATYAWSQTLDLGLTNTTDLLLTDINADDALDLVTLSSAATEMVVRLGNRTDAGPDGTFASPNALPLAAAGESLGVGDFEGDGYPDLVVVMGQDLAVVRNTAGALAVATTLTAGAPVAPSGRARIGDISGDGWPDVVAISSDYVDGTKVEYWPAQTDSGGPIGGFEASMLVDVPSAMPLIMDVDVGDVDGDGLNDLVVAGGLLRVFTGTPAGPESMSAIAGATGGNVIGLSSLDDDPQAEIIIADQFGSSVLIADWTGDTWEDQEYGVGFARGLAVADANGDGFTDVIAFESNANTASVLHQIPGATLQFGAGELWFDGVGDLTRRTVGDINGDGAFDMINGAGQVFSQARLAPLGSESLDPATSIPVGADPRTIAVAELDCRAGLDGVVVSWGSGNARTVSNTPLGTFETARLSVGDPFGIFTQPYSAALGDINGDGVADLVVASVLSSFISVHLGIATQGCGNGQFAQSAANFRTVLPAADSGEPRGLKLRDFDLDGDLDLVFVHFDEMTSEVLVYSNDGAGTFTESHRENTAYTDPIAVEVADFDGDGRNDLAVATQEFPTSGISVHLQDTGGALLAPLNYDVLFFGGPSDLVATDLNDDQILDLVVSLTALDQVQVLWGNEDVGMDGVFTPGSAHDAGDFPFSVAVFDGNFDGIADVATADLAGDSVTIVQGSRGAPTFEAPVSFTGLQDARSGVVADFSGDGLDDVLAAGSAIGRIQLFQSRFEGYDTWTRRLGVPSVLPIGFVASDEIDALGQRNTDRVALRYDPTTVGSQTSSFGPGAERNGVLAMRSKPMSHAFRAEGTHLITREDVQGILAWRIAPRLASGTGLDWTSGRGLEIRWPLLDTRSIADLQNLVLIRRTETLRDASTWSGDPLDSSGVDETLYLPCHDALCDDPVVQTTTSWTRIGVNDLATVQSALANGAAVDTAAWELVVRTDVGGVFQLFAEP